MAERASRLSHSVGLGPPPARDARSARAEWRVVREFGAAASALLRPLNPSIMEGGEVEVMAGLWGSGRRATLLALPLTLLVVCAVDIGTATAIPAFARKYATSCQPCHTVFPKLNAFGVAFRLSGYRIPNETEEMIKEKPVSLGAPAYKKLWPKAVWPGEIASAAPLAVNVKFAYANASTLNGDGSVSTSNNDFQFPQELNVFPAGTLGDHISSLTEVTFS